VVRGCELTEERFVLRVPKAANLAGTFEKQGYGSSSPLAVSSHSPSERPALWAGQAPARGGHGWIPPMTVTPGIRAGIKTPLGAGVRP
jgi:hypothetical protein